MVAVNDEGVAQHQAVLAALVLGAAAPRCDSIESFPASNARRHTTSTRQPIFMSAILSFALFGTDSRLSPAKLTDSTTCYLMLSPLSGSKKWSSVRSK